MSLIDVYYNLGQLVLDSGEIENSNTINALSEEERNIFTLFIGYWIMQCINTDDIKN